MTIGLVLDSSQVGSVGVARGGGETTVHRAMQHLVPTHGGAPGRAPPPPSFMGQPRPEPLSLLLVGGFEAVTSHSPETVLP